MMLTADDSNDDNNQPSYASIFDHCTNPSSGLQKLFFDDLFERGRLVYFDAKGKAKFPSLGGTKGTNTLKREGREEVSQPIKYQFAQGRPLGSPQAYYWRERRRAEYGPP